MKSKTMPFGIVCGMALLLFGCKAMWNDNRQYSNLPKTGGQQTNDLLINVHVTNEPPEKLTLTLEATNSTPKVKVPLEVNIKATNSSPTTELPLIIKADNEKTDKVTIPIGLEQETNKSKPFTIPIKLTYDTNEALIVPVKFALEANGTIKTVVPVPSDREPWGWQKAVLKEFGLLVWLVIWGVIGGLVAAFASLFNPTKTTLRIVSHLRSLTPSAALFCYFLFSAIIGCIGGLMMPSLIYLIRGDIFANDRWSFLIITSASLIGGMIGPTKIKSAVKNRL